MKALLVLALAFYLVGLIQAVMVFLQKPRVQFGITMICVGAGFILHTAAMIVRGMEVSRCPIALQPELLTYLGWTLTVYYLIANLWNRNSVITHYVFPFAFLCTLAGVLVPIPNLGAVGLRVFGDSLLFPLHVSFVIFAYGAFFITFLTGLMYIWQERELKLKRFGNRFFKLPALDTCDAISYKSMTVGFVLLTIGIVTGIIWSGRRDGVYWHGDPIEIMAMATWLIYMFMIHYRVTAGWRGRRTALIGIIGFALVIFSFVGLKYLGNVHGFGVS